MMNNENAPPWMMKIAGMFKDGKWRFSKEGERRFYFILTMGMLLWGILYKVGLI